jgi:effector-binding domain-containing protein
MKKRNWMPMLALAAPMLLWAQPDTAYGEPGVPRLTNLPPQRVLAIEAQGDPDRVAGDAFKALFRVFHSGADKAERRRQGHPMARWETAQLDSAKSGWKGSYALPISEAFPAPPPGKVRDTIWQYGLTAEILHAGSYDTENGDIAALKAFIARNGLAATGSHEEVYLRGPGMLFKGKEANYRTLIRYSVERIGDVPPPIAGKPGGNQ